MDDNDEWNDDLVVDAAQMREATPRVMERYAIPADRSADLKEESTPATATAEEAE